MIVVSPDIKNMDLYAQIFKIDDIKNIKKFNRAISIFVSDKKCITLGPPPDIQTNIFINHINEIIEKIKAKK